MLNSKVISVNLFFLKSLISVKFELENFFDALNLSARLAPITEQPNKI